MAMSRDNPNYPYQPNPYGNPPPVKYGPAGQGGASSSPQSNIPPPQRLPPPQRPTTQQPLKSYFPSWMDLSAPGAGENWWDTHGEDTFGKPGAGEQYWRGMQGKQRPNQAKTYWDQMRAMFTDPGEGEKNAYGAMNQLNAPGEGVSTVRGIVGNRPSSSDIEDFWRNTQSQFMGPGFGEDYISKNIGKFGDETAGEQFFRDNQGELGGSYVEDFASGMGGQLAGNAYNARDFFRKTEKDYLAPSYAEDNFGQLFDPLMQKSYSESLFEDRDAETGYNRFYSRAADAGERRLNDQMAARGGYNSGAAIRGIQELNADLGAQQARDMASLAAQGDSERRSRLGLGSDITGRTDSSKLNRLGAGQGAAGSADESVRANVGLELEGQRAASDAKLGRIRLGGDLSKTASDLSLSRLQGGIDAGLASQDAAFKRLKDGGDIADKSSRFKFDSDIGYGDLALRGDTEERGRIKDSADIGLRTDKHGLDRAISGADVAGDVDDREHGMDMDDLDAAFRAQAAEEGRVAGGMSGATTAQNLRETRIRDVFERQLGISKAMAEAAMAALSDAQKEQVMLKIEQIQARVKAGEISSEDEQASLNELWAAITAAAKATAPSGEKKK